MFEGDDGLGVVERMWLDGRVEKPPMPFRDGPLVDYLLDLSGVVEANEEIMLHLCKDCHCHLKKGDVPPLFMSNKLFIGPQPLERQDLTVVGESMIAQC